MKIISLNYLTEDINLKGLSNDFGMNFKNLKKAVSSNLSYDNKIGKIATVNQYRGFDIVFRDQVSANYENDFMGSFINIIVGDELFFYPYYDNTLMLEDESELQSYFSLKIFEYNQNQRIINPQLFLENFNNNVKKHFKFILDIKQNFQAINQRYEKRGKIISNNIKNLPNYESQNVNTDFLIMFKNITKPFTIDDNYDHDKKSRYKIVIEFTTSNPAYATQARNLNNDFATNSRFLYRITTMPIQGGFNNVLSKGNSGGQSTIGILLPKKLTDFVNITNPQPYQNVTVEDGRQKYVFDEIKIKLVKLL